MGARAHTLIFAPLSGVGLHRRPPIADVRLISGRRHLNGMGFPIKFKSTPLEVYRERNNFATLALKLKQLFFTAWDCVYTVCIRSIKNLFKERHLYRAK